MEVLHIIGESEGYLRLPSGKPSLNITKMASQNLSIPLATGLQKAFQQSKELAFNNLPLRFGESTKSVNLRFLHLPASKGQIPLVAVLIEEAKKAVLPQESAESSSACDLNQEAEQRISDLEQELQFSRENLQATIEELETSNEELQATNEELVASNEELQATNEELQSTNEELYTVNAEYQNRIIELTELNHDVDNLLTASMVGTLLLDENLEVRRFSPQVTNVFRLLEKDIGRPIGHIAHFLQNSDPLQIIQDVQSSGQSMEEEVQSKDGRWYLMRVVPYAVGPDVFSGTVLTFVDISKVKKVEQELRESEQKFSSVANTSPALIWMSGTDKLCNWFNDPWLDFTGRSMEQEMGHGWTRGIHPDDYEHCLKIYTEAFDRREKFEMEYRLRRHDGEYRWILDIGQPRHGANKDFLGYIGSCLDISDRKMAEKALRGEREQIFAWLDHLEDGVFVADMDSHVILYANAALQSRFGKDLEGGLCHEQLQGLEEPCSMCSGHHLQEARSRARVWNYHNDVLDMDFRCVDKIIHWHDGREVCLRLLKALPPETVSNASQDETGAKQ